MTLAEALYAAATPQPRPPWGRARAHVRTKFAKIADAVLSSGRAFGPPIDEDALVKDLKRVAAWSRRERRRAWNHGMVL